jgi:hypothetical protein
LLRAALHDAVDDKAFFDQGSMQHAKNSAVLLFDVYFKIRGLATVKLSLSSKKVAASLTVQQLLLFSSHA